MPPVQSPSPPPNYYPTSRRVTSSFPLMANIHGLHRKRSEDGGADDDDNDDDDNKLYVGGADGRGGGSGQNVMDPTGGGSDPYAAMKAKAAEATEAPESGRVITMYANGFTVDDGPFRSLNDPTNQEFIQEMNSGYLPSELRTGAPYDRNISLKDKSSEEYVPPAPPAYVAYSGNGQATGASVVAAGALVGGAVDDGVAEEVPEVPEVDPNKPSATIAVRLHTGKRMRARLNLEHSVRHLQALIAQEGAGDVPYVLMAGFPPSQLTDFTQTIGTSGLAGSQVTQKQV